jgi:prepilin-type N-terminal cleavage/methylation domain-containing protein
MDEDQLRNFLRNIMKQPFPIRDALRGGFSLVEMLIATVVLLVGLVGIAQLVPMSVLMNYRNRTDSSALVFAQREMDMMLDQPISRTTLLDPQGILCPPITTCSLGSAALVNAIQGSPVTTRNGLTAIDFGAGPVPNFSFTYQDPADPSGLSYDVRWAVIVTGNGSNVYSKRFIVGVRQQGGDGYVQPVTLDTMVQK